MAERTCERCGGPYTVWDGCLNLGCTPHEAGPLTDQQLQGWSAWGHTTPQYQAAVELLASRRRTEELKALLAHVESEQEFGMERSGRDDGADGWQVYANAYGSVAERLGRILGGGLAQVGECSHAIYHADCSSCNERDPEGLAEGNEEVE